MDDVFLREPGFLTKVEACHALRISLASLNRAMSRKELEYFQMTEKGKVLFTEKSLREFLELKRFTPSKRVVTSREQLQLAMKILNLIKQLNKTNENIRQLDVMKASPKYQRMSAVKEIKFLGIYDSVKNEKNLLVNEIKVSEERAKKLLRVDDCETKSMQTRKE